MKLFTSTILCILLPAALLSVGNVFAVDQTFTPDAQELLAIRNDWSGSFRFRSRGGFLVTCVFEKGTPKSLTILSERSRSLRLVNPFAACAISVNGQTLPPKKDLLTELPTKAGENIQFSKAE